MAETRTEYERDSEEESAADIVYAFEEAVRRDHENALKEGEDTPEIRDSVRRCIRLRNDLVDLLATLPTPREPEAWMVWERRWRGKKWSEWRHPYWTHNGLLRTKPSPIPPHQEGQRELRIVPLYRSPSPYTDEDGPEGDGDE